MAFSGSFTKLINGLNLRSKYSSELCLYTSTCKKDPSLESFDSSLHQQTNRIIGSLASRAEGESLPIDSLMEVNGYLLELNQEAVRVIIESREDVWKNNDLRSLVGVYFQSTAKTLDFCNTVQNCVRIAENRQLIIRFAVKQFETESTDTEVEENKKKKKKYAKTLEELNKFAAMGDPFDGKFVSQYESFYEQQVLLLEELRKLKERLNKKQRNAKTWRILSNVVFATAFATALVLSIVLAAMTIPPVASAVAAGLAAPIQFVGQWFNKICKDYEKGLKREKDLVKKMEKHATGNKEATETIRTLVENLRIRISSILKTVEFSVKREEEDLATKIEMDRIKKEVDDFAETIEKVGQKASSCSKIVAVGRLVVLKHIFMLPANSV